MPHRGAGVAPIFAALEGGYYREHGLEPEFLPYHGHSNSLKALIAEVIRPPSSGPAAGPGS